MSAARQAPLPGIETGTGGSDPADAFPREQALSVLRHLPAYGRLAWAVARDPQLPPARRGVLLGALAYLVSPIDAIPGIIPFLGQLDDVLVVVAGLRLALAGLPAERRQQHFAAVGLSDADLNEDLGTLRALAAWLARRGARTGLRLSRSGLGASAALTRRLGHLGVVGASRARRALQRAPR